VVPFQHGAFQVSGHAGVLKAEQPMGHLVKRLNSARY